ncbi:3-oxo-tetronate kinase [Ornithinimicrobium sp. W1679]|uniref:3-oxo-tetronate kinase n=1 Tax=Ornithinimicrobium sp. W1679 TaxID=3418770 RepID=UPI003CE9C592
MTEPIRGAVADDFTGATDLAGNWAAQGLRTSVLLGVPPADEKFDPADDEAVVVALKTRSASPDHARDQSVRAGRFLLDLGCGQLYDKYCSTFDSTPAGNIGPVADALLELTGAGRAVVVPSYPDNGRTVYQGHLFVGRAPLHESPMRNHPLTPMLDSDVTRLLAPQTRHEVGLVTLTAVDGGPRALRRALDEQEQAGARLVVVDAVRNADLRTIAEATRSDRMVTGGSGLALGVPARAGAARTLESVPGHRAILSGSASTATRAQVRRAAGTLPSLRLDVEACRDDLSGYVAHLVDTVAGWWRREPRRPVLVYSVGSADDLDRSRHLGEEASSLVESALAHLAVALSEAGATELLVAGGETSGAVMGALGVRRLEVGQPLGPGVSWLRGTTAEGRRHNVVLKSGNFGHADLFLTAWEELR